MLQRKIDNGSTPIQALRTTYGVELMPDNVQECRQRLKDICLLNHPKHLRDNPTIIKVIEAILTHNIVCADSLTFDYDSWQPLTKVPKSLV